MTRKCGECSLCCKMLRIEELDKPQGQWCPNFKKGVGCTIHGQENYPKACGEYKCVWLMHEDIPDHFRCDKVKAVIGSSTDGQNMVVYSERKDLSQTPLFFRDWLIDHVLKFMHVVVVAGEHRVVFPKHGTDLREEARKALVEAAGTSTSNNESSSQKG